MSYNYDFTVKDVSDAYDGAVGTLWEFLMGEHIHVGGEKETIRLADKLGIRENNYVLDVCSALGGPARYLAKRYKAKVLGIDITGTMLKKAIERTAIAGLADRIEYRRGNALDLPVKSNLMDFVWGQDAWCYVTCKPRLISEVARVCKRGGKIGFTDWILGKTSFSTKSEADSLFEFMIFPNLETMQGYSNLLEINGCKLIEAEDLQNDFASHLKFYLKKIDDLKDTILKMFGEEMYNITRTGVKGWAQAAKEGKVSRGLWIAKKL